MPNKLKRSTRLILEMADANEDMQPVDIAKALKLKPLNVRATLQNWRPDRANRMGRPPAADQAQVQTAIELRRCGKTWDAIAQELGLSRCTVIRMVGRALVEEPSSS